MAISKIQELLGQMQKNLECSICLELLKSPVATKCEHYFCRFCITEFLETKKSVPCPLCKQPITKRSLQEKLEIGGVVDAVNKLISAFQDDSGTVYSPPKGPQSFFPCTPETINTKPDSKVKSKGKKNVRNTRRSRNSLDIEDVRAMFGTDNADSEGFAVPSHITVPRRRRSQAFSTVSSSSATDADAQSEHNQPAQDRTTSTSSAVRNDNKNSNSTDSVLQYLEEGSCGFFSASPVNSPTASSKKSVQADSRDGGEEKAPATVPEPHADRTSSAKSSTLPQHGEVQILVEGTRSDENAYSENNKERCLVENVADMNEKNLQKSVLEIDKENVIEGVKSPSKNKVDRSRVGLANRASNVVPTSSPVDIDVIPTVTARTYSRRTRSRSTDKNRQDWLVDQPDLERKEQGETTQTVADARAQVVTSKKDSKKVDSNVGENSEKEGNARVEVPRDSKAVSEECENQPEAFDVIAEPEEEVMLTPPVRKKHIFKRKHDNAAALSLQQQQEHSPPVSDPYLFVVGNTPVGKNKKRGRPRSKDKQVSSADSSKDNHRKSVRFSNTASTSIFVDNDESFPHEDTYVTHCLSSKVDSKSPSSISPIDKAADDSLFDFHSDEITAMPAPSTRSRQKKKTDDNKCDKTVSEIERKKDENDVNTSKAKPRGRRTSTRGKKKTSEDDLQAEQARDQQTKELASWIGEAEDHDFLFSTQEARASIDSSSADEEQAGNVREPEKRDRDKGFGKASNLDEENLGMQDQSVFDEHRESHKDDSEEDGVMLIAHGDDSNDGYCLRGPFLHEKPSRSAFRSSDFESVQEVTDEGKARGGLNNSSFIAGKSNSNTFTVLEQTDGAERMMNVTNTSETDKQQASFPSHGAQSSGSRISLVPETQETVTTVPETNQMSGQSPVESVTLHSVTHQSSKASPAQKFDKLKALPAQESNKLSPAQESSNPSPAPKSSKQSPAQKSNKPSPMCLSSVASPNTQSPISSSLVPPSANSTPFLPSRRLRLTRAGGRSREPERVGNKGNTPVVGISAQGTADGASTEIVDGAKNTARENKILKDSPRADVVNGAHTTAGENTFSKDSPGADFQIPRKLATPTSLTSASGKKDLTSDKKDLDSDSVEKQSCPTPQTAVRMSARLQRTRGKESPLTARNSPNMNAILSTLTECSGVGSSAKSPGSASLLEKSQEEEEVEGASNSVVVDNIATNTSTAKHSENDVEQSEDDRESPKRSNSKEVTCVPDTAESELLSNKAAETQSPGDLLKAKLLISAKTKTQPMQEKLSLQSTKTKNLQDRNWKQSSDAPTVNQEKFVEDTEQAVDYGGQHDPGHDSCGSSSTDDLDIVPADLEFEEPDLSLQPEEIQERLTRERHQHSHSQNKLSISPATHLKTPRVLAETNIKPVSAEKKTSSSYNPKGGLSQQPKDKKESDNRETPKSRSQLLASQDDGFEEVVDSGVTHVPETLDAERASSSVTQTPAERSQVLSSTDQESMKDPIRKKRDVGRSDKVTSNGTGTCDRSSDVQTMLAAGDNSASPIQVSSESVGSDTQSQSILKPLVLPQQSNRKAGQISSLLSSSSSLENLVNGEADTHLKKSESLKFDASESDTNSGSAGEDTVEPETKPEVSQLQTAYEKSKSLQDSTQFAAPEGQDIAGRQVTEQGECVENSEDCHGDQQAADVDHLGDSGNPSVPEKSPDHSKVLVLDTQQHPRNSEQSISLLSPRVIMDSFPIEEEDKDRHSDATHTLPGSGSKQGEKHSRKSPDATARSTEFKDKHSVENAGRDLQKSKSPTLNRRKRKLELDNEEDSAKHGEIPCAKSLRTPDFVSAGPSHILPNRAINSAPARTKSVADNDSDDDAVVIVRRTKRKCFSLGGSPLKANTPCDLLATKRRRYSKQRSFSGETLDEEEHTAAENEVTNVKVSVLSAENQGEDGCENVKVADQSSTSVSTDKAPRETINAKPVQDHLGSSQETAINRESKTDGTNKEGQNMLNAEEGQSTKDNCSTPSISPVGRRKKTVRGLARLSAPETLVFASSEQAQRENTDTTSIEQAQRENKDADMPPSASVSDCVIVNIPVTVEKSSPGARRNLKLSVVDDEPAPPPAQSEDVPTHSTSSDSVRSRSVEKTVHTWQAKGRRHIHMHVDISDDEEVMEIDDVDAAVDSEMMRELNPLQSSSPQMQARDVIDAGALMMRPNENEDNDALMMGPNENEVNDALMTRPDENEGVGPEPVQEPCPDVLDPQRENLSKNDVQPTAVIQSQDEAESVPTLQRLSRSQTETPTQISLPSYTEDATIPPPDFDLRFEDDDEDDILVDPSENVSPKGESTKAGDNHNERESEMQEFSGPANSSSPVACKQEEEEEEEEEVIGKKKKSRTAVIDSDSESYHNSGGESEASFQNFTSSSALSTQSEIFTTQERSKMEVEMERLRGEIAEMEAKLRQASSKSDNSGDSSDPTTAVARQKGSASAAVGSNSKPSEDALVIPDDSSEEEDEFSESDLKRRKSSRIKAKRDSQARQLSKLKKPKQRPRVSSDAEGEDDDEGVRREKRNQRRPIISSDAEEEEGEDERCEKKPKQRPLISSDAEEGAESERGEKKPARQQLMDDFLFDPMEDDAGNDQGRSFSTPPRRLKARDDNLALTDDDEDSSDLFLSPLSPSPPPPAKHTLARKELQPLSKSVFDLDDSPGPSKSSSLCKVRQSLEFETTKPQRDDKRNEIGQNKDQGDGGMKGDNYSKYADIQDSQEGPSGSIQRIPESQFSEQSRDAFGERSPENLPSPICGALVGSERRDNVQISTVTNAHIQPSKNTASPTEEDDASVSSGSLPSLSPLKHISPDTEKPWQSPGIERPQSPDLETERPQSPDLETELRPQSPDLETERPQSPDFKTERPCSPNLDTIPGSSDLDRPRSSSHTESANNAKAAEDESRNNDKPCEDTVKDGIEDEEVQDDELPNWKRSKFGFISSGLDPQRMVELRRLAELNECKVYSKFNGSVTHVIMKTSPGNRICDRTLKYFQGIAGRCWVLSCDWILDSLQDGRFVPEEEYEIKGDTVKGGNHVGPRSSRLSDVPLLKDFAFALLGASPDMSKKELTQLLEFTGAQVLEDMWDLAAHEGSKHKLVLRCVDSDTHPPTPAEVELFNGHYKHLGLVTVAREWILDSICTQALQPLKEYVFNTCKDLKLPI